MTVQYQPLRITSPTLHATIIFTISVFLTILVMSFVFRGEVVAHGHGRVVPINRVQVVQPEFSGRITTIHAKNGNTVQKGDVLLELDPTDAIVELGTITAEQDRLHIEKVRIDAMAEAVWSNPGASDFTADTLALLDLPPRLANHPFADGQRTLLATEISDFLASMALIDTRKEIGLRSEDVVNANIARIEAALATQTERLHTSEQLLEKEATSRADFLDVRQAFDELEHEREVRVRELRQKIAERTALDDERRLIIVGLRKTLQDRKIQIEARLATLAEKERAARRRVDAATLTAPASGVLDQLSVFTVGAIAEAGAELMRIVPSAARLEIEGTFSNRNIGFMKVGQQANIRLDAYPSERFGFVKGRISDIAADSTETSDGQWGYIVRIMPDHAWIRAGGQHLPLRPGMTVEIDVTTDRRRIISYFFAPIMRTLQDAMGER